MTDNEIIKALECCIPNDEEKCLVCPFHRDCIKQDKNHLAEHTLNLINRQKAEIERLHIALEENQKSTKIWKDIAHRETGYVKTATSEAVKEFADRLCDGRVSNDPVVIAVKVELKEMVGEANVPCN